LELLLRRGGDSWLTEEEEEEVVVEEEEREFTQRGQGDSECIWALMSTCDDMGTIVQEPGSSSTFRPGQPLVRDRFVFIRDRFVFNISTGATSCHACPALAVTQAFAEVAEPAAPSLQVCLPAGSSSR